MFVNKIVDTYYSRGVFRGNRRIQHDKELQSWVNEISIHGKKQPDGGKGKVSYVKTKMCMIFRYRRCILSFTKNACFRVS